MSNIERIAVLLMPLVFTVSELAVAQGAAAERSSLEELLEPADNVTHDARWETLRKHYFGTAEIASGEAFLSLEAPTRAHDAAVVPISIQSMGGEPAIRRLHLIVDKNPLPLAGIFTFDERARGWQTLETRIRINEYTHVRAVAELTDETLVMVSRFVKAAGGCSAPAMADLDAAMARAGQMKLLIDEATNKGVLAADGVSTLPDDAGSLASATIKISHPNNSGMQFDQVSRNYIPAFFVQSIGATVDGKPLLSVDTNFSLSENPVIGLTFPEAAAQGVLDVQALDSRGNEYTSSAPFASGS